MTRSVVDMVRRTVDVRGDRMATEAECLNIQRSVEEAGEGEEQEQVGEKLEFEHEKAR